MRTKRLIVNADDLGLSVEVTDGILMACQAGIVTSASLMVNLPASEYSVEKVREAPKLGVGVHLNISFGCPILSPHEIPTIVSRKREFYECEELRRRLTRWQVSSRDIEAEFRAQIRWVKHRGIHPTHADSHHQVHCHPRVAMAFARALLAEDVGKARQPRYRLCPKNGGCLSAYQGPWHHRFALASYLEVLHRVAFRKLRCPDYCVVVAPHRRNQMELFKESWLAMLRNLPYGTYELACHPSLSKLKVADGSAGSLPEVELRTLIDPQLRLEIERNEIELISYAQL